MNALKACDATAGILIVLDAPDGPGSAIYMTTEQAVTMVGILRRIADDLEIDLKAPMHRPN